MCDNMSLFERDFIKVRDLGFVPSSRPNNTGVGKTFEDFIGIVENNRREPDLHGFEVKAQRSYCGSYVTLFTKSPTSPIKANQYIRDKYGYPDRNHPDIRIIHTSIFHNRICDNSRSGFKFKLQVDMDQKRLYVLVYNSKENIIDHSIYYSFDSILYALRKIQNLAYVSAKTEKRENSQEYFHFTKAIIFSEMKGFDYFIEKIIEGKIMYDVRIGSYKSGLKRGDVHDHGSGFRVKKEFIRDLYHKYADI